MRRPPLILLVLLGLFAVPASAVAQGPGDAAALGPLNRGTALFRGGDFVGAIAQWSAAIQAAKASGAPLIEAEALARRGEAYRTQGHVADAGNDLRSALALAEKSGDQRLIASVSGALGGVEFAARRNGAAEPLLERSRDLARRSGDRATEAAAENDLGNLYAATGRPALAKAAYNAAIAKAAAMPDDALAADAATNAARLALQQNDTLRAGDLLGMAVGRLEHLPPSYNRGLGLVSAGSVLFARTGPPPPQLQRIAERAFRAAEATADQLHSPALSSQVRGALGRLYERSGRTAQAEKATDQALFAAQEASAPELAYRWDWQQARLARQQGRTDAALDSYRRAIAELQSIRQDIPVEYRDGRSSYRAIFGPLYLEFTDLLLRKAPSDPAQSQALIREARVTIEALKETELQDYFRDSCIANFEARRRPVETIAPGSAVLYPVSLPDRVELLLSVGNQEHQVTLPVTEAALRREVTQFRELLEKRTTNEYLGPAQQLYRQIVRPIEPLLYANHIDTFVVIPDEVLRVIPFAALHDGQHFLIERYATAIAPSLHLIDPKPLAESSRTALVLGVSQPVQGFVDLPNVPREIQAVAGIEGGEMLLDAGFTRNRFATELRQTPYNVVHIASHGQFGTNPKQTFVLAYDGKLTMDDLETDIKYGERRTNAIELLVLSACETASGDDRAALGLAGVALKAGARSALASLWYISDQAAGDLVVDFYRQLQQGEISKAQALRAAQRQLLSTPRYAHPAYWAPFLLIGNWL